MLFSNSFEPFQGRYHRVYNEARVLITHGFHVTLLAWDRGLHCKPIETVDGIEVRRFRLKAGEKTGPRLLPKLLLYWLWILRDLGREPCEVLHLHNIDVLPLGVFVKWTRKAVVLLDVCEPDYYTLWDDRLTPLVRMIAAMERGLSRRVDAVLVHNRYQVRKYNAWGIGTLEQVGSYPTSSMIQAKPRPGGEEVRTITFGTVGTFFHNSGGEETIAAFGELASRHDQVRLLLAGRVMEYYREHFEDLLRPLGDRVEATGAFDSARIPEMYQRIDVSVMVCRRDRWYRNITPTKFFDSLANGVPVIASDIGGLGELISEIGCGIVVDETRTSQIAGAMEYMIEHPIERAAMGERALAAARTQYNFEKSGQRLLKVYRSLTGVSSSS
ncbi:MAG: glycosyltransferase [Armatimonadetes bacterium]|nr:glycosyltransferase [Armatimonadota bacterium]